MVKDLGSLSAAEAEASAQRSSLKAQVRLSADMAVLLCKGSSLSSVCLYACFV
jgi:hypothetical protein